MSTVNVQFRPDRKRWQVTYHVGGKRKRPLFAEEQEARNFARKIKAGLQPEDRDAITIAEVARKYFDGVSMKKAPKSRCNDKRYLNLLYHFMAVERGIEKLYSVELEDMEAFRDWLLNQREYDNKPMHMSASSVNRCLRVLKHVFKKSIHWKHRSDSPCTYLEYLEAEEKPRAVITSSEFLVALEAAEAWLKPVLQFMYLTGAPASCVERLQWADVDFGGRRVVLTRRKGRHARLKRIELPMTDQTFALLVMVRNAWPLLEGEVFRDSDGRRLLADRVTRAGNLALKTGGVKGKSLYSLRHALASELTQANVATEIVRQAMGHASIATTQRYANKGGLESVAGALESVRGGSLVANLFFAQRRERSEKPT